jgi:hypothetical protein
VACGRQEHGAVDLNMKMCEGCNKKRALFGTAAEGTKRWCRSCGQAHGAVNLNLKMCEACRVKPATKRHAPNCKSCFNLAVLAASMGLPVEVASARMDAVAKRAREERVEALESVKKAKVEVKMEPEVIL